MAKDYSEDIARLSTAKRTHFTHFQVGKLPWHGEDHVFGEGSDDKDRPNDDADVADLGEPGVDKDIDLAARTAEQCVLDSTVFLVETGKCYWCRERAVYGYKGKLYCVSCWFDSDDDRDLDGGGA